MAQATCTHCGEPFEPKNGNQIYCQNRCRWAAKARMQAARNSVAEARRCSRCRQVKPGTDFGTTHTYCRPCSNDVQREWRAANPELRRLHKHRAVAKAAAADPDYYRRNTLRKFGLTLESFAALLHAQGGCCAICGVAEPGGRHGMWHVDHDRSCCPRSGSCGRCIRGLLCQNCNILLGHAKDSMEILGLAIAYLSRDAKP